MSYVMATPEMMAAAATDVAAVGSTLSAAHMAAAAPTVAVIPAAADEVSAGIAQVFSRAAQEYQALAGQAAAFNQKFVQHLTAGAGSYAAAEAANAAVLQPLSASAGSAASAISAMPAQILNTLTSLTTGLVSSLELLASLASALGSVAYIVAYYTLVVGYELLLLVQTLLGKLLLPMLGVSVPF
jgi:PE family